MVEDELARVQERPHDILVPCATGIDGRDAIAEAPERTTWVNYVQIAGKTPRATIPPPKRGGPGGGPLGRLGNRVPPVDPRRAAYEDVMWALLNSSEFVFNH